MFENNRFKRKSYKKWLISTIMLSSPFITTTVMAAEEPIIQIQKADGSFFPANANNNQVVAAWDAKGYTVNFKTDASATCKYSTSGGNFGYNSFRGEVSTSDGIQHYFTRSHLYKPKKQTNWLKCESTEGNIQNTTATAVEIYFGNPSQPNPPQVNLVSGEGPFEVGIEQYDVILTTDISSQCRFSTSGSYAFGNLYNHFTSSEDGLTHTKSGKGSYNGTDSTIWAQCRGSENGLSTVNALEITTTFRDKPAAVAPIIQIQKENGTYYPAGSENNRTIVPWNANGYSVNFKTDVASTCKYSTSGGNFGYNAFRGDASTIDGIQHTFTRSNLYKPKNQTNWLKCESSEGNIQNTTATSVEIYFGNPEQTEPPTINLESGEGPFEVGIEQYDVILTTDISAQCRYSTSGSYSFGSLYQKFTISDDGRTHTKSGSGSYNGADKTLWAQCRGSENGLSTTNATKITTTFSHVVVENNIPECQIQNQPTSEAITFNIDSGSYDLSTFLTCTDEDNDILTFRDNLIDTADQVNGDYQQTVTVSDGKDEIEIVVDYQLKTPKIDGEPTVTLVFGEGPFPYESKSVDIQVTTDIPSECRFSTSGEYPFGSMYEGFTSSSDGKVHDMTRGSLYKPKTSNIWAQCRSIEQKVSTQTVTIITSVFALAPEGPDVPTDPNDPDNSLPHLMTKYLTSVIKPLRLVSYLQQIQKVEI